MRADERIVDVAGDLDRERARRGSNPERRSARDPRAAAAGRSPGRCVEKPDAKRLNIPAPPSLVALPPMPTMKRRAPPSKAARINSPKPNVVVTSGLRRSGGASARPEAAAISRTATPSPVTP